jgi:flavin-dependent dehydrogenase
VRPHVGEPTIVVLGGGPAGCAAATLLSQWGHAVTLFTRGTSKSLPLGESIPPSTQKLFDVLGVRNRLNEAAFIRSSGNTVWWGSDTPRVELFADGAHGWQVTTAQLEAVMREMAAAANVRLVIGRIGADADLVRRAAFVLDCSGRAGVLARGRGLRINDPSRRSIAMVGLWAADRFDVVDHTHTLVESYDGGWVWSVPVARHIMDRPSGSERFVAVMVDPRTSGLLRESPSSEVYLSELRKATAIQRVLGNATLRAGPRGWDASMYHASRYVDENVLLVGDAGSFIDPLSSAGVKKALASAWLAAVATHTSLTRPQMRAVALDFFAAREHEVYDSFRAMTDTYWRDAASAHAHPFWTDRATDSPRAHQDAVRAAFDQVRQAPRLRVARNTAIAVAARPAVSGSEIVLEQRLVQGDGDPDVRHLHDVDVVSLITMAPQFTSVPALFEAYNAVHAPVDLPDFLAALATAIAEKWLLWCDTN